MPSDPKLVKEIDRERVINIAFQLCVMFTACLARAFSTSPLENGAHAKDANGHHRHGAINGVDGIDIHNCPLMQFLQDDQALKDLEV
jgi:hypothetical protein